MHKLKEGVMAVIPWLTKSDFSGWMQQFHAVKSDAFSIAGHIQQLHKRGKAS
jgi:hypothetical protein